MFLLMSFVNNDAIKSNICEDSTVFRLDLNHPQGNVNMVIMIFLLA